MGIYQGDICLTQGKTGKSAYQYAVDGGYTGTEAEYAALVANIGMKGVANGVASLNSNIKVPDEQLGMSSTTAAKFFASVTGAETVDQVLSLLGAAALKDGTAIKDALGNLITLPSAQLDSRVQIATGSYTGTGLTGSSNPITLNFGINAKLLFWTRLTGSWASPFGFVDIENIKTISDADTYVGGVSPTQHITRSSDDSTDRASFKYFIQETNCLNVAGNVYCWTAIGV